MKSSTICFTVFVLALGHSHLCSSEDWNRADEQSKARFKAPGTKSYQSTEEPKLSQTEEGKLTEDHEQAQNFASDDLAREHEVNLQQSLQVDSAKSVRTSMDTLVRDMRSRAMNKVYQSTYDVTQAPVEQSMDNRGPEHDHEQDNIRIAVQSKRRYEFVPVHFDRDDTKMPKLIEIVSDAMPLRLHFKSQSAAIVVTQSHMSPPVKPLEETVTMDEPYRLSHEVHKPIIQEVKEIIQPYRNIVQQVKPVIEDIRTIVPKDNDVLHQHQQGGMIGAVNPREMLPRRTALKPPPPRASPATVAQQLQGKYSPVRQVFDAVKGSESQPRIQRRMQLDESHVAQGARQRRTHQYGRMQFGSSEPEVIYLPMLPKMLHRQMNSVKDTQRLGDYFASKGKYQNNPQRFSRVSEVEFGDLDREVAESGRMDTINTDYSYNPYQEESNLVADHYQSSVEQDYAGGEDEEDNLLEAPSVEDGSEETPFGKRTYGRCHGTGRCHAVYSESQW